MHDDGPLHARLLDAHRRGVPAEIAMLYTEAADRAEAAGEIDRACFFLTHAWVYALEAGVSSAVALKARLMAHGRDVMEQGEGT